MPTLCSRCRSGSAELGLGLDDDAAVQQLGGFVADVHPGALGAGNAPLPGLRIGLYVHDIRQRLQAAPALAASCMDSVQASNSQGHQATAQVSISDDMLCLRNTALLCDRQPFSGETAAVWLDDAGGYAAHRECRVYAIPLLVLRAASAPAGAGGCGRGSRRS